MFSCCASRKRRQVRDVYNVKDEDDRGASTIFMESDDSSLTDSFKYDSDEEGFEDNVVVDKDHSVSNIVMGQLLSLAVTTKYDEPEDELDEARSEELSISHRLDSELCQDIVTIDNQIIISSAGTTLTGEKIETDANESTEQLHPFEKSEADPVVDDENKLDDTSNFSSLDQFEAAATSVPEQEIEENYAAFFCQPEIDADAALDKKEINANHVDDLYQQVEIRKETTSSQEIKVGPGPTADEINIIKVSTTVGNKVEASSDTDKEKSNNDETIE